jgi:metallophosphoesterase superfamily enzyme
MSVHDWSTSEDRKLAKMWLAEEPPRTIREIADELEKSKSAVDRRITTLGFRGHQGDRALYEEVTGVALDPVIKPVQVKGAKGPSGEKIPNSYNMIVWGDVHFPYQDDKALDILYQITEEVKPEVLVCLGDVFDFAMLSSHREPELEDDIDFQTTLNLGAQHLAKMVELAEPSEAYFIQGNHEDRWDRLLLETRRDVRMRQLMRIPSIRKSLTFSEVVGFEKLGYKYTGYTSTTAGQHQAEIFNGRMVIVHGDISNKWACRTMLDRYGTSVIFGHSHRIQNFTRRDLKGQESAWNIGCLCLLDQHYTKFTDWGHAFAVVTWSKVDGQWLFNVELVRIHDGVAIWRDNTYIAS